MSYTAFNPTKPNFSDGRAAQVNSIRANSTALRDAIVCGCMPGFSYSWSGGSADQPTYQFEKNGNTWIRKTFTWGVDGNPESMLVEKSTDGGSTYTAIGAYVFTYDEDGNFDAGNWVES